MPYWRTSVAGKLIELGLCSVHFWVEDYTLMYRLYQNVNDSLVSLGDNVLDCPVREYGVSVKDNVIHLQYSTFEETISRTGRMGDFVIEWD